MMDPGVSIGIISAQNIIRNATQSNLSSFHHLSSEETQVSIPITDIMNITNYVGSIKFKILNKVCLKRIKYLILKDIVSDIEYPLSKLEIEDSSNYWYKIMKLHGPDVTKLNPNTVRILLNPRKMLKEKITMGQLQLLSFPDRFQVHYSTDMFPMIDIIDTETGYVEGDTTILDTVIELIQNLDVKGIKNLRKMKYLHSSKEVITEGSDILSLVGLIPEIDETSIQSTNIKDVYRTYGIEAARYLITKLFKEHHSEDIYCSTIANYMCKNGKLESFNSMNQNVDTLTKMLFEKPQIVLRNDIIKNQNSSFYSIYSEYAVGQKPNVGTHFTSFDLLGENDVAEENHEEDDRVVNNNSSSSDDDYNDDY